VGGCESEGVGMCTDGSGFSGPGAWVWVWVWV